MRKVERSKRRTRCWIRAEDLCHLHHYGALRLLLDALGRRNSTSTWRRHLTTTSSSEANSKKTSTMIEDLHKAELDGELDNAVEKKLKDELEHELEEEEFEEQASRIRL